MCVGALVALGLAGFGSLFFGLLLGAVSCGFFLFNVYWLTVSGIEGNSKTAKLSLNSLEDG